MNDQAARILSSLIERYGTSLALDPLRCEGLLRDTCPRCSREIFVLVNAIRQQVPADLLAPRHSLPPALFRGFLIKRLQDEFAFSEEAARWAVDTWAGALGQENGTEPGTSSGITGARMTGEPVPDPDNTDSGAALQQRASWIAELESMSVGMRLEAIRELARSRDTGNIRLLITALEDSSWRIREAAFEALLEIGKPAVPGLIKALANPHERVVIPVVIILGTIRADTAVDPLLNLLDAGGEPVVYVIQALGEIGDHRAITPLTKFLKNSDPRYRTSAEQALMKFG